MTTEARLAQLEARVEEMSRSLAQVNTRAESIEGSFRELLSIIETYMNEAAAQSGGRDASTGRSLASWLQLLVLALLVVIIAAVAWATLGSGRATTSAPVAPTTIQRSTDR